MKSSRPLSLPTHTLLATSTNPQDEPRELARERDAQRPGRASLLQQLEQAYERIIADPRAVWTFRRQQVFREVMERDMSELSSQDKEAVKHVRLRSRLTPGSCGMTRSQWIWLLFLPPRTGNGHFRQVHCFR